jgi:heme iron utilization protein
MNLPLANALNLLHSLSHGVLATHASQVPGYPYASVLPFALDDQHAPVFLISTLAEHTKNLSADPRASLLVHAPVEGNVLAAARLTLVGDAKAFAASDRFIARYLRYQPDAERYLALADFAFFRLEPVRLRFIAGFGEMGWLDGQAFAAAACISLEDEEILLREAACVENAAKLLGVDPYGVDLIRGGARERQRFLDTPLRQDGKRVAAPSVVSC